MNDKLRFVIGENCHDKFEIWLGDENIADRLQVKSLKCDLSSGQFTTVTLEVYADEIDIMPKAVNVELVNKVQHHLRMDMDCDYYSIPEHELKEFDKLNAEGDTQGALYDKFKKYTIENIDDVRILPK